MKLGRSLVKLNGITGTWDWGEPHKLDRRWTQDKTLGRIAQAEEREFAQLG